MTGAHSRGRGEGGGWTTGTARHVSLSGPVYTCQGRQRHAPTAIDCGVAGAASPFEVTDQHQPSFVFGGSADADNACDSAGNSEGHSLLRGGGGNVIMRILSSSEIQRALQKGY